MSLPLSFLHFSLASNARLLQRGQPTLSDGRITGLVGMHAIISNHVGQTARVLSSGKVDDGST